jgi:uncharacterized protein
MSVLSPTSPTRAANRSDRNLPLASILFAGLLLAFWFVARHFGVVEKLGGHMPSAFASFALMLAPYWFFGFGAAEFLREKLTRSAVRVLLPGLLVIPYLIFSIPRGEFQWMYGAILFAIPVGLAALFEFAPPRTPKLCWQDALALAVIGFPIEFHMLVRSFPEGGLSAFPKFLMVDAALYAFLVVRRLEGVGYDFRARWRDLVIGLREWAFFAPIAIGLGLVMSFISFHSKARGAPEIVSALMVTFFFVAVPEELFFRGLLQSMLEARIGRMRGMVVAAAIFGVSHFNKMNTVSHFNWRYVLLAAIAGIFYGRAWRDRHRIFSSGITHTLVDVIWGLWFK